MAFSASLQAKEAKWTPSFKFQVGSVMGNAKDLFVPAGSYGSVAPTFGAAVDVAYNLNQKSALVFGLGLRFQPGDNGIVSYIELPATAKTPAWAVGNTYTGESRNRKADGQSYEASALYRRDFLAEGLFWQAGLRIGFNKATQIDTGSRATYTVSAVSGTGIPTWNGTTTATAIASTVEKKTTSVGVLAGLGYRFNDRYSGELNAYQTKFEGASAGKLSGTVIELAFGVRF